MKKLIIPFLLLALVLILYSCTEYGAPKISIVFNEIVHAGGELWGVDSEGTYRSFYGSNSLEGLTQCAENGYSAVELDFSFTSDEHLVCIHDWSPEYIDTIEYGHPLSYDEFKNSKIYWNFTPIGVEDVAGFLAEHTGMYIVTDIKEDFDKAVGVLSEVLGEYKDRVIVQIYAEDEYDIAADAGFSKIIYSLYRLDWESKTDYKDLVKFSRTHSLVGFTFSYELCGVKGYVDGMLKSGIPLYVHTVNDPAEAQKYYSMGINGIYTDIAAPRK